MLHLNVAPNDWAAGTQAGEVLESRLTLGGADSDIGFIADVSLGEDGSIWLLDRINDQVRGFTQAGQPTTIFGREGPGPGEFADPWALTAVGDKLVIWDRDRTKTFLVFGQDGSHAAMKEVPVQGDWLSLQLREPDDRFEPGVVGPSEDITRRLDAFDSVSFVHQTQPDEVRAFARGETLLGRPLPMYLIHYNLGLDVLDTVATLAAPPLYITQRAAGAYPLFSEGYFPSRSLWTTGDGWLATRHRDSTRISIVVIDSTQTLPASIYWEPADASLDFEDRLAFWELHEQRLMEHSAGPARNWLRSMSRRERRSAREAAAKEMVTPSVKPELMALYGAGQCLWLAGFSADDHHSGVSLSLVAIGLESRQVEWFVRIPRSNSRIRDVAVGAIAASYVDPDGIVRLDLYRLPDNRCAPGRAPLGRSTGKAPSLTSSQEIIP